MLHQLTEQENKQFIEACRTMESLADTLFEGKVSENVDKIFDLLNPDQKAIYLKGMRFTCDYSGAGLCKRDLDRLATDQHLRFKPSDNQAVNQELVNMHGGRIYTNNEATPPRAPRIVKEYRVDHSDLVPLEPIVKAPAAPPKDRRKKTIPIKVTQEDEPDTEPVQETKALTAEQAHEKKLVELKEWAFKFLVQVLVITFIAFLGALIFWNPEENSGFLANLVRGVRVIVEAGS